LTSLTSSSVRPTYLPRLPRTIAMASSPAQPFLYGGTFLFLLALIFLISATAVPQFTTIKLSFPADPYSGQPGSDLSVRLGAFQLCADFAGVTTCAPISGSCGVADSGADAGGLPYCGTFNAFRGFLVTALILSGFALLGALAHTCQASPNVNIGHFTFVAALLAAVTAAITLVCWASWSGSLTSTGSFGTIPTGGSFSVTNAASFFLLISALVAVILGLAVFIYGRVQQKVAGPSGGGEGHFHAAPPHYISDVQLNQPLSQQ